MATTHLTCPDCSGKFDYEFGALAWFYHGPGNVSITTADGEKHRASSLKFGHKHQIKCPYCGKTSSYEVNLR